MKNPILLITAIFILLTSACEEKEAASSCSDFVDRDVLTDAPVLGFQKLYLGNEIGSFFNEIYGDSLSFPVDSTLEKVDNLQPSNELFQRFMLNLDANNRYQHSPKLGYAQAKDTARINEILSFHLEKDWMKVEKVTFIWGIHEYELTEKEIPYFSLYGIKEDKSGEPVVNSKYVKSAEQYYNDYSNELSISISMNEEGAKVWGQMTSKNVGNFIAIIAENKVLSAPVINGPITGGKTMITGGLSKEKTQELVDLINCEAYSKEIGLEQLRKEVADCSKEK